MGYLRKYASILEMIWTGDDLAGTPRLQLGSFHSLSSINTAPSRVTASEAECSWCFGIRFFWFCQNFEKS
ncbi:hypothetical protein K443DRAFT_465443 [Laccaria amethystina LaAM-08-1]|uniref:Uncharacterized protein n=1 Tax=Laccaria amethystina LaAM-08-1 TaxID=1095629 RepID=A0A0C9Y112_9AGAR|nr:hypothetical protein K443DRAFT_465443 [Laccaria amethystina LaAM-08-1]